MTLKVRQFKKQTDLKAYQEWFTKNGWNSYPVEELLSDYGLMVVDEAGGKIAACFVYFTNSKIVLMEWLATNPSYGACTKVKAIDALVDRLKTLIHKGKGIRFLIGATDNQALRRHYLRKHRAVSDQQAYVVMWDASRGRFEKHGN